MNLTSNIFKRLELFEWVGILASICSTFIFFYYGSPLDRFVGKPSYHWYILTVVLRIYWDFIPYAISIGAVLVFGLGIWMHRSTVDSMKRFWYSLRIFLAYCILLIVFRVVNFYVPVLHPGIRDTVIQQMDQFVFGQQVSNLLQPIVHRWLTHILTGAYVSWFWLLFATIILLAFANRNAASEYLLATLIAFYMGYVCYILVPVIGPGYVLHYPTELGDIAPTFTTNRLFIPRDAFPSLHTATSVLMCIYVFRYQRKWLYFYIPMALLIVFSTLYLRIHYGSDDIAGAALAVVISEFTPLIFKWFDNHRAKTVDINPVIKRFK